jgi:hypothetical protein
MSVLNEFKRDLLQAARTRLPALEADPVARQLAPKKRRVLPGRAASYGWVPALIAAMVALAVAGVALTSLSSRNERALTAGRVTGDLKLSAPLIADFAVLRRPQTLADIQPQITPLSTGLIPSSRHETYRCAGDRVVATPPARPIRLPAQFLRHEQYAQIECQLLRVVRVPQWHARVLIAPITFRPHPRSATRVQGMNVALADPVGGITGTTGPGAGASGLARILHGEFSIFENGPNGTIHGIILIPDGVTTVTLDDVRLTHEGSPTAIAKQTREALATLRLTAIVDNNIAAVSFDAPTVTTTSSPFGRPSPSRDRRPGARRQTEWVGINVSARQTWLNSTGTVVRRSRTKLDLLLRVRVI